MKLKEIYNATSEKEFVSMMRRNYKLTKNIELFIQKDNIIKLYNTEDELIAEGKSDFTIGLTLPVVDFGPIVELDNCSLIIL